MEVYRNSINVFQNKISKEKADAIEGGNGVIIEKQGGDTRHQEYCTEYLFSPSAAKQLPDLSDCMHTMGAVAGMDTRYYGMTEDNKAIIIAVARSEEEFQAKSKAFKVIEKMENSDEDLKERLKERRHERARLVELLTRILLEPEEPQYYAQPQAATPPGIQQPFATRRPIHPQ